MLNHAVNSFFRSLEVTSKINLGCIPHWWTSSGCGRDDEPIPRRMAFAQDPDSNIPASSCNCKFIYELPLLFITYSIRVVMVRGYWLGSLKHTWHQMMCSMYLPKFAIMIIVLLILLFCLEFQYSCQFSSFTIPYIKRPHVLNHNSETVASSI